MLKDIKGIIFDYGGTIDTNSVHWSEVLWEGYQNQTIPVSKEEFRNSYVFAERALAKTPYIKPEHNFLDLLMIKCDLETQDLVQRQVWTVSEDERVSKSQGVAHYCYDYVLRVLKTSRAVIEQLSAHYPLVLVSNFYGNIHTILKDFNLEYFKDVIESAVVGVRKPDPRIFQLGVDALREKMGLDDDSLKNSEVLVVGDSFSKDIVPADSIGCKTIWIKGKGWGDEVVDESVPSVVVTNIAELCDIMLK